MAQQHIYSVSEIVGTSETSVDDAIRAGITRMSETIRNIRWFEVKEVRGHVDDGKVAHFQVTLKVGFGLEER
jgi:flavin-binding protein dodecin